MVGAVMPTHNSEQFVSLQSACALNNTLHLIPAPEAKKPARAEPAYLVVVVLPMEEWLLSEYHAC